MTDSQYIVIVGCGRLGALLASRLSGQGNRVVVIDLLEESFEKIASEFSGFKIVGDAVEMSVLRQAKIEQADHFLAITNQDNINLMLAQVAKQIFQVTTVIARVYDPAREAIYEEFGVNTISPTKLSAEAFLNTLEKQNQEREA